MPIVLGGSCGVIGGPLRVHFQKRPFFRGHPWVWRDGEGDGGHFEVNVKVTSLATIWFNSTIFV